MKIARLEEIFRQGKGSAIIDVAAALQREQPLATVLTPACVHSEGPHPSLRDVFAAGHDAVWVEVPGGDSASEESALREKLRTMVASGVLGKGKSLQVLSPMRKGDCGSLALNTDLQALLNPAASGRAEISRATFEGVRLLRQGDRVMQIANNYDPEKAVFNGDQGVVERLQPPETAWVCFQDGRVVSYDGKKELAELEHSYALSVHKAQGSEFDVVVLVLCRAHSRMMYKRLIYTAVSRASQRLVILASNTALGMVNANALAENNFGEDKRNGAMVERYRTAYDAARAKKTTVQKKQSTGR